MTKRVKNTDRDSVGKEIDNLPESEVMQEEFLEHFEKIKAKQAEKLAPKSPNNWCVGGEGFKAVRMRIGLSQSEFADLINVSKTTLSTWETGLFRPRFQTLLGIKFQLLDFGKKIGQDDLGDLIKVEDFGYTRRGTPLKT